VLLFAGLQYTLYLIICDLFELPALANFNETLSIEQIINEKAMSLDFIVFS